MSIPIRLAADIGGTFTDVVLESEAGFQSTKVLTTLNQPEIGVMQGIDELLRLSNIEPGQITHVIHGTTLGTNTVIERKGAKTAFLTTEGFRDILEMGYEKRYDHYDIYLEKPPPLVPRKYRLSVRERISAEGKVLVELDQNQVLQTIRFLKQEEIEAVAVGWVLDQTAVGAVIIGARLTESEHRADNANLFSFTLDQDDHQAIDQVISDTPRIKGDCGSEYRQPPYLTAAGDLSDHLEENKRADPRLLLSGDEKLQRLGTGSYWESVCGYSRAVKKGGRILLSGTTAIHGEDRVICRDDPRGQAVYILDKILSAVSALGGQRSDIVRTRVYLANQDHCESVSRVHGRYFEGLNPANTTIEVSNLIGDHLVEIEAEAIVDEG